jgi:hypothetical protein
MDRPTAHPYGPPAPDGTVSSESNIFVPISLYCGSEAGGGCVRHAHWPAGKAGGLHSLFHSYTHCRSAFPAATTTTARTAHRCSGRSWLQPPCTESACATPSTASSACQTPRKMNPLWRTHVLLLLCATLCGLAFGKYFLHPPQPLYGDT